MDWIHIEHPNLERDDIYHARPRDSRVHLLAVSQDADGSWCWSAFLDPSVLDKRIDHGTGFADRESAQADAERWFEMVGI